MLGPTFSLVTPRGRPAFIRAASLLGLWALGGCAVGPRYARPEVSVAEAWRERDDPSVAASAAVEATWWREFGDATLDQLVELTRRQNLPLQIAGLRIMEARAQLGIATGLQYPQVQAAFGSLSAVGLSKDAANVPGADRRFADYQVGLQAAWEIDFWGKYRRGVEADTAAWIGSVADYDSALVSLTAEVARTYAVIRTEEARRQALRPCRVDRGPAPAARALRVQGGAGIRQAEGGTERRVDREGRSASPHGGRRRPMVEGVQRPDARRIDPAGLPPEPAAADRGPEDPRGARPTGHRLRVAVSSDAAAVRQRDGCRPQLQRR